MEDLRNPCWENYLKSITSILNTYRHFFAFLVSPEKLLRCLERGIDDIPWCLAKSRARV